MSPSFWCDNDFLNPIRSSLCIGLCIIRHRDKIPWCTLPCQLHTYSVFLPFHFCPFICKYRKFSPTHLFHIHSNCSWKYRSRWLKLCSGPKFCSRCYKLWNLAPLISLEESSSAASSKGARSSELSQSKVVPNPKFNKTSLLDWV